MFQYEEDDDEEESGGTGVTGLRFTDVSTRGNSSATAADSGGGAGK